MTHQSLNIGLTNLEDNYDTNDPKNGGVIYEPGKSTMIVIKANARDASWVSYLKNPNRKKKIFNTCFQNHTPLLDCVLTSLE
jgi:hypothetical protein